MNIWKDSSTSEQGRGRTRRSVVMGVAAATAAAGLVVAGSGVAQAATGKGYTGFQYPSDVWSKAASGFRDFNVTYTYDTSGSGWDIYHGYYHSSTGWHASKDVGWTTLNDGSHGYVALVTNVSTGTPCGVGSYIDGGDYVEVAY